MVYMILNLLIQVEVDAVKKEARCRSHYLSFNDATTDDILRAAIVLNKDDKINRRGQIEFCDLFLLLIVVVSILTIDGIGYWNSVPTFLRVSHLWKIFSYCGLVC